MLFSSFFLLSVDEGGILGLAWVVWVYMLMVMTTRIFELQNRGLAGFIACCLFGLGSLLMAPYYAVLWRSPLALVFTYLVPILPFVLVFDGWMSCLRTRTPDEIEALLRTCGAKGGDAEIAKWEVKSGSEMFMWPVGSVNWVIAVKKDGGGRD